MKILLIFSFFIIGALAADHPAFVRIGEYKKTKYYVPVYYRATWTQARSICKDYGYELASFQTLDVANAVIKMCRENSYLIPNYAHIDGFIKNSIWYLAVSGTKISYPIPWKAGEPNNFGGIEHYMCLGSPGNYLVSDIDEQSRQSFICQQCS